MKKKLIADITISQVRAAMSLRHGGSYCNIDAECIV